MSVRVNLFLLLDNIPLNSWNECLEHWFFFFPLILFWYAFEGYKFPLTTALVASYMVLYTMFIISFQNNFNFFRDSSLPCGLFKSVSSFSVYGHFLVTFLLISSLILLWLKSICSMISVLWNTVSLSFWYLFNILLALKMKLPDTVFYICSLDQVYLSFR